MGTIRALRKGVEKVNLNTEVPKIIEATADTIISLNQKQLYESSIDSLGEPLKLYGSVGYALSKERINPLPGYGRPDLKLTGAFYRGFNVSAGYTGIFTIDSSDSKTPKLENIYGKAIFGLTSQNKTVYAKGVFFDRLKEYITKQTGLIFR